MLRPAILALSLAAAGPAHAADACDVLTAKVIRVTGTSLAGRTGPYAVFRAEDAERMSLDCRTPARLNVASAEREPPRAFFVLVGLAARALTGAEAHDAEVLALDLHQKSLLGDAPRRGETGPALMLCETAGDRSVCRLAPAAGLSRRGGAG